MFASTFKSRGRRIATVVAVASAAGAVYVSQDEGLKRAVKVQSRAMGPFIRYHYTDWRTRSWPKEKRAAAFEQLHNEYSKVFLDTILEMRGFYIKFGQLISGMDNTEQVPRAYTETLKVLQKDCPSMPVNEVIGIIEKETGKPFSEIFTSIDPKPLGSASIGQVHRAKLLSGEIVAVKVQHPEAERFFRVDFETSKQITRMVQPAQLPLFNEIEKLFVSEFNYELEAQNLRDMNETLQSSPPKYRDNIIIPRPLICTRKLLVMSFVPGKTLYGQQRAYIRTIAEREGKTEDQVEEELKAKVKDGDVPVPPSQWKLNAYKAVITGRDAVRNTFALTYNLAIGRWIGAPIYYEWTEQPMDSEKTLDLMYGFFGYSMLKQGMFSSDAHGGNVIHVPGGKLGLIDMGQLKRLSLQDRLKFAKLVLALADDNGSPQSTSTIAQRWRECGYVSKYGNEQVTADLARFFFDRWDDDLVNKYGGFAFCLENMEKADPIVNLPGEFVMCMRASVMLRMNAMSLGYGLKNRLFSRVTPLWVPFAAELVKETSPPPDQQ